MSSEDITTFCLSGDAAKDSQSDSNICLSKNGLVLICCGVLLIPSCSKTAGSFSSEEQDVGLEGLFAGLFRVVAGVEFTYCGSDAFVIAVSFTGAVITDTWDSSQLSVCERSLLLTLDAGGVQSSWLSPFLESDKMGDLVGGERDSLVSDVEKSGVFSGEGVL